MDNIDLDNITTIEKSYTRTQDYDIRYSLNQDKFRVSDGFYRDNAMNMNGFTLHLAGEGDILLLSVQANEDSVFYKGKESEGEEETQKGTAFANSILSEKLRTLGMVPEDAEKGSVNLSLESVGEKEDKEFFRVTVRSTSLGTDDTETEDAEDTQTEIADNAPDSEDNSVDWGDQEDNSPAEEEEGSQVVDLG